MNITNITPDEDKHSKETALFFLLNESEKNKQTAFLRYYGKDSNNEEENCSLLKM